MPKTYTAAGTVAAGDVYTAAAHNIIATDVNNFIVPPMCRLVCAASQTITTATDTLVTLGTNEFDTDSMGTTGASAKITINTTGIYQVSYSITLGPNAGGTFRAATIVKNGTGSPNAGTGLFWGTAPFSGAYTTTFRGSGLLSLTAADYLQLSVYQDSGSSVLIGHSAQLIPATFFSAVWVGRTS